MLHENKKKVGILTFQNAFNYGALLQAYALQEKCKELGCDVHIVNYQNRTFNYLYKDYYRINVRDGLKGVIHFLKIYLLHFSNTHSEKHKINNLKKFVHERFKITEEIGRDKIEEELNTYDLIIVGSDQVWNTPLTGYDDTYFLPFDIKAMRISYAASIGKDYVSAYEVDLFRFFLSKFDAISVREKQASSLIQQYAGLDSNVVLDPTLLFTANYWYGIAAKAQRKPVKKYILLYIIQKQKKLAKAAVEMAKKYGYELISLSSLTCDYPYTNMHDASIEEFLYLIANAECIFSSSFHGIAFAINFNKNFYYELADYYPNNNSRIIEITSTFDFSGRNVEDIYGCPKAIDWVQVNQNLILKREESELFLSKWIGE